MQSMLLYPRRSRFAPNLLKNNRTCILTLEPANVNKGGFVKSPISALRFIPRHCGVPHVHLIPRD